MNVAISLTIMRNVPERMQGRLFAAMILLVSGAQPLGPLAAGLSLQFVGHHLTMVLLGAYVLTATAIAALRPDFRNPGVDGATNTDAGTDADDEMTAPAADLPVAPATD
ncbi:MAG TPA: hypothetical protein VFX70_13280 [Mycobacteriales bacterium]|nr:hypothetical protein [Mycobacteriales bacterium]